MIRPFLFSALFFVPLLLFTEARATQPAKSGFLGLSLGRYETFERNSREVDFRLEYRPANLIFLNKVKPWVGIEATSRAGFWGGGGFLADFDLSEKWRITPSFGVGLYSQGQSETDLNFPVQFRSQIEISYVFQNDSRLGLALSHMSNAGLGNHNPGAEVLALYYFLPFSSIIR